jgi:hypothetical protein
MKVIKSDSGLPAYQKIFKQVQSHNSVIVLWQLVPETGERKISESRLNSFHLESKLLHFEVPPENSIVSQLPVYCYSEDGQFIFKSDIQIIKSNVFSIFLPAEIHLLEDSEITLIRGSSGIDLSGIWKTKRMLLENEPISDILKVKSMSERSSRDKEFLDNEFGSLDLEEEEKLFADKRESPRARAKTDKWVKVKVEGHKEIKLIRLFDLSRGGIGFITLEPQIFSKGKEIEVVGFAEFDLDDPLVGMIVSQRSIDDSQVEFKIGVRFNEGQD